MLWGNVTGTVEQGAIAEFGSDALLRQLSAEALDVYGRRERLGRDSLGLSGRCRVIVGEAAVPWGRLVLLEVLLEDGHGRMVLTGWGPRTTGQAELQRGSRAATSTTGVVVLV